MTSGAEPYLQIDAIGMELRVYRIHAPRSIRGKTYDVRVGDVWVPVIAVEPIIDTGGPPVRAVYMQGRGSVVEQLMGLETLLRTRNGVFQMRDTAGEVFAVTFKDVHWSASLYASGTFLSTPDPEEFPCRLMLPEDHQAFGFAHEAKWERRRVLHLGSLPLEAKLTLIRAVVGGGTVLVERIPWDWMQRRSSTKTGSS